MVESQARQCKTRCMTPHAHAWLPTSTRPGGIYGIGGGSLLSPILVGRGVPVATVAPAALTSTFVTSVAGAATYVTLALTAPGQDIAPHWIVGVVSGLGGLCGGYLGAHLQPVLPEKTLRAGLGLLAIATAVLYGIQAVN